jgi:drug/metabolite transporter (DMT)-like permease
MVAIAFLIIYKPNLQKLSKESYAMIMVSSILGVIQMVLKFYGFQSLGVVETTMVLLLGPIFVYAFSYFFFGEKKLFLKDALAAGVIVSCIIYVNFFQS